MPRLPLLIPACGWVAGLAVLRCDSADWGMVFALALVALLIVVAGLFTGHRTAVFICSATMLAGLAWGWVSLLGDARQVSVGDDWLHGEVSLTAVVDAVRPQAFGRRLQLADVMRRDGHRLPGKVWLYDYRSQQQVLLPGDRVAAVARFHRPRNARNPSGFDFVAWCFDRHIALLGSAVQPVRIERQGASVLELARQRIRRALAGLTPAGGGVLRALLLGERQAIPERVYDVFAATGAAHLLAISGLHIGLVAGMGFVLCWFILTRREDWIVRLAARGMPVRGLSMLAGVLLAALYAQLACWPLPTERAALMLAAAALAWWLRAQAAPLNTLLAALMLILLFDPAGIVSLSLWLSFLATAAILLWAGSLPSGAAVARWRSWLSGMLVVTLLAWLVTLPLVAHVFGRLAVYSLPANLLATPLYTLFVLPLALLGGLFAALGLAVPAHALFALAASGVDWGDRALTAIAAWPGGHLWLPAVPFALSLAYAAGMAFTVWLLLRGVKFAAACCAVVTLLAYVAGVTHERPPQHARFIAWDVGQGAAASLILPGGKVLVMDAAGRPGSRFNAGTTMADGLRGMGLAHVDVLVISHAQSDHDGGALSLLQRVNRIGELWLADVPGVRGSATIAELVRAVCARGGKVRLLKQGDTIGLGAMQGRVLWPPADYAPRNANNASLVLRLQLPGGASLFMGGDVEAPAEVALLALHENLASDVMLLPHHGSTTSSTPALLAAVRPVLGIAQTGFANRYNFPAPAVVQRYRTAGAELFNTADGAVLVHFAAHGEVHPQLPRAQTAPPVVSQKRNSALQWWRHFL